jgi:putative MFS transporter
MSAENNEEKLARWPLRFGAPSALPRRQSTIFLLVGLTILFNGYDLNVFGLALPLIQRDLHIPEDAAGLTATYFRLATLGALFIAPLADLFGRRRLLLFTVFGEAFFALATAFAQNYPEFVWLQIGVRVFGYCEELLCFVVIAEEIDESARGWSIGSLGAMNATGGGLASIAFALVDVLPFGWRALYALGGSALFVLAWFRRLIPETKRFEVRREELARLGTKTHAVWETLGSLLHEYPGRLAVMLAGVALFDFSVAPSYIFMSKYLQETEHYAHWQITVLYVFGGFLSVVGNIIAGRLSDRLGRKTVIVVSGLVSAASFYAFFSGISGWMLPAAWIGAIFGYLSAANLLSGFVPEIFPTAYRATSSTLRYVISTLGGALALALEGVLYDRLGAHAPAISLFLFVMPVAMIAILLLPETARKPLEEITHV